MPTTPPGQDLISELQGIRSMINSMRIDIADAKRTSATALNETRANTQKINSVDAKATNADSKATRANQRAETADGKASRSLDESSNANKRASNAEIEARTAKGTASNALGEAQSNGRKIEVVDRKATKADRDAAAAFGESKTAKNTANSALSEGLATRRIADTANSTAKEANGLAKLLKNSVDGLEKGLERVGGIIRRVEGVALDASFKALRAIGLSESTAARVLKLTGEVASVASKILGIIDTIANMLTLIFALQALGGRIDEVERGLVQLGNSVGDILGRYIPGVRAVANLAKSTAESAYKTSVSASSVAGNAFVLAQNASTQAQSAQGTATQARQEAGQANNNALRAAQNAATAYIAARTAINLYQTLRNRPGIPGKKGDKGDKGERGLQGIQGIPGVGIPGRKGDRGERGLKGDNGVTLVVQLPGTPGPKGDRGLIGPRGFPGINGKDGKDVNPGDVAQINAQLAAIRAVQDANQQETRGLLSNIRYRVSGSFNNLATNAQLAEINAKLGAAIPNGIGGFLTKFGETFERFQEWSKKTQVYSLITMFITLHNALMLSNNLGQTLISIINTGLQVIGLKDSNDQPYDIGAIISNGIQNTIKSIVGESNYTSLSQNFMLANRIYQSTANLMNQIWNLGSIIANALEMIASWNNKIGNALKRWGIVGGKAYNWMPESPNFHSSKFFLFLNTANETANTVQAVAQIPLDVKTQIIGIQEAEHQLKQSVEQTTLVNEQGQNIAPLSGFQSGEATQVRDEVAAAKTASIPANFDLSDLFDADD